MPQEVVKMRARGFICVNAHPEGCRKNVERQIAVIQRSGAPTAGPRTVLVIGASTGYGLASRIAAAWGFGARTLGVFFERQPEGNKTATAGWYNSVAVHQAARGDGLYAASINGDAFSDDIKRQAIATLRRDMLKVDLVVYSLASPRRTHPRTGVVHNSTLKPIGAPFTGRTIDLNSEKLVEVTIPPADEVEIADTVAVMGGDDWRMWIDALLTEGLLAEGARSVAYSYIGPAVTWPIYRDGTIGRAKQDLEQAAAAITATLRDRLGGGAWVSVNKAVVTQASAAIPVVPLYLSLLPRVMKAKGLEEGCIEQMRRLLADHFAAGTTPRTDDAGRIRVDDREMRPDVQEEVAAWWPKVTSENLATLTDFPAFKREFRSLFGFEVDGVDYAQPTEIELRL
jgi:enoyl-[acyl-carrier protein] reductase/trans-2-enoyl-CoA reductase (NAD+)